MRVVLIVFLACFATTTARADGVGLRSKDIIGIALGMNEEAVRQKITDYNPAMAIQRTSTVSTREIPAYTIEIRGMIPKKDGTGPQDEITVRFFRRADGSVLSNAVAHLVYPLPEDQRVLFKTFTEKLIQKYGPISNMNEINAPDVRWVFTRAGVQKLRSLDTDINDYNLCSSTINSIGDSSTRANIPETAIKECGDFLYVRLFPLDPQHPDVLAGYFMTYINQNRYLNDIDIENKAKSEAKGTIEFKKLQEQKQELEKNVGPKL